MTRIRSLMMIAVVVSAVAASLFAVGLLPPSNAIAAEKWQAVLTSTDGGATNVACLTSTQQTVRFQPIASTTVPNGTAFCYKTCATSTCVPDCTKDFILNRPSQTLQTSDAGISGYSIANAPPTSSEPIQLAADKCVVAWALDGGNPNANLYLSTKNLQ